MSLDLELTLIGISLLFSAFFSSSEIALSSLANVKVIHILNEKGGKAKDLKLWLKHPNKMLNTILIGNNIVNIFASVLATDAAKKISGSDEIAITTGVMTILILFFGEITPKTFAKHNAEKFALAAIRFLKLFYYIFYPLTYVINIFVTGLIKIVGGEITKEKPLITEEELEFMINVGGREGILKGETKDMMHNIMDITGIDAKEIMVPRIDMTSVHLNASMDTLLDIIEKTEYSRIPVYANDLDDIKGILYVKDLLAYTKSGLDKIRLKDVMREVYFVPETKNIYELFKEFQKKRVHMAIVVDEYGGVAGLVTLEDILEEIVGEIRDEYDKEEEEEFIKKGDGEYIVNPKMDLDDFVEKLGIEKTHDMEDYESVGGLVFDLAGKIPDIGDEFIFNQYKFKVLGKEENKLLKIGITKIKKEEKDEK